MLVFPYPRCDFDAFLFFLLNRMPNILCVFLRMCLALILCLCRLPDVSLRFAGPNVVTLIYIIGNQCHCS